MLTYSITGTIHEIGPTEVVGTKGFAKRTVVLVFNANEAYPDYVAFEATRSRFQDRTLLLDAFAPGDECRIEFAPQSREWTAPDGRRRWFASLRLVHISRAGEDGDADGGDAGLADAVAPSAGADAAAAALADDEAMPF